MPEKDKLDVEQGARAHAAHSDRVARAGIAIQDRLRAVGLRADDDRSGRAAGQRRYLGRGAERLQGGDHGLDLRCPFKGRRHAAHMPIAHGDAIALRADRAGDIVDPALLQGAQHLERLGLDLVLLAANVGHDVAQDVQGGDARVPGPGDGLHRGHGERAQAKGVVQRLAGQGQRDGRAVGTGDDQAAPAAPPALHLDQRRVTGVDLGDQERHIGVGAVRGGVRTDGVAGAGKALLRWPGDPGGERGEDQAAVQPGLDRPHDQVAHGLRHRRGQQPVTRLLVALPGRALGCGDGGDLEPGVVLQQLDEALTDGAGRA